MRRATYTKQQIIAAGEKIHKENKVVTPFGIRNMLGGGNTQRIKRVWEDWIKNNHTKHTHSSDQSLPQLITVKSENHAHVQNQIHTMRKTLSRITGLLAESNSLLKNHN